MVIREQVGDMENRCDFLEWLGSDTSTAVLACLDDPADIVRASSVSRAWRRFVISNGFCKKLCQRMYPEVSNLTRIVEVSNSSDPVELASGSSDEWGEPVGASSTDNYPDESIDNTLEPSDRMDAIPSYWSSGGSRDPDAPETLTYKLSSRLCVVHEIKLRPFQAYFQPGDPIYSAKAVRFRMGHSKPEPNYSQNSGEASLKDSNDFVWTHVSPVFPMAQANVLQSFKLPRPVLCIGGALQIELLGRVQQQEMDNMYYICVCHVKVIGNPLFPRFDADVLNAVGEAVLKYYPDATGGDAEAAAENGAEGPSGWHAFAERFRQMGAGGAWNHALLNAFLGNVHVEEDADSDEDYGGEELFED
ncbi:unnamed protein product [Spirodela intermedia]|uniref:Uncharacterized protein n=1 Tax=Spirodela intermedia TaxID=51605 RepID=A0A7I8JV64_SPIIN|nr:unnamed protein product [Spirodela intermedia]CAA6673631.1 unnamed protein product [Spirodela intermedia]